VTCTRDRHNMGRCTVGGKGPHRPTPRSDG
jgi:hypothetical protein